MTRFRTYVKEGIQQVLANIHKMTTGGVFLSYQTTGFGTQSGSANIYDTHFGIYAGYHKNAADAYVYADYG